MVHSLHFKAALIHIFYINKESNVNVKKVTFDDEARENEHPLTLQLPLALPSALAPLSSLVLHHVHCVGFSLRHFSV